MTIGVDELTTDVSVEDDRVALQATAGTTPPSVWAQAEQLRAADERARRDAARTRAEAYDD